MSISLYILIKVSKSIFRWLYMTVYVMRCLILFPSNRLVNYSILLLLDTDEKIFHNLFF